MSGRAAGRSCCASSRPPAGGNEGPARPVRADAYRDENVLRGAPPGRGKSLRAWNVKARVSTWGRVRGCTAAFGSYIGAPVHVAIGRNSALLSRSDRLYLDHAATTPLSVEARAAMAAAAERWANPSSPHADGRAARAALEDARKTIADALGWRHDVILTSGASEAIQIVAARAKAERRILGPTEHEVVAAAMGQTAMVLPVDSNGIVDIAAFRAALADGPALFAIQQANN